MITICGAPEGMSQLAMSMVLLGGGDPSITTRAMGQRRASTRRARRNAGKHADAITHAPIRWACRRSSPTSPWANAGEITSG